MRVHRGEWLAAGRPRGRGHLFYDKYKTSKATFRRKMRQYSYDNSRREYERIDNLAEVDQARFWKEIKRKRKRANINSGKEMKFHDTVVREPSDITTGWENYFSNLYALSQNSEFDDRHKDHVDNVVCKALDADVLGPCLFTAPVTAEELCAVVRSLPRNKAPGLDGISYEHLANGGYALIKCLLLLYNRMLNMETVPIELKQGLIITLHKGKGKPTSNPNSYRAISLLPTFAKVFEKVLYCRIENSFLSRLIHPFQHGFRKNTSCKMVSFIVQECIHYTTERGSRLYTCFLDAEKAFDRVWINGLLYKLFQLGVVGKDLRLIASLNTNMTSRICSQGYLSKWISIEQGTRQGGILSPFMYTIYVNDLLRSLEQDPAALRIGEQSCGAPTQADDIVILSLSKSGLDSLLSVCYNYSLKWRYTFNPTKCVAVVFGESKTHYRASNRIWHLGPHIIQEAEECKHLGIVQSKFLTAPSNLDAIIQGTRGSILSLIDVGVHKNGINPLTALKIYERVVLPRTLFGCELWSTLSKTALNRLEIAHHFCMKVAQGLPRLTRSDMALSVLGTRSIEAYIDSQKLNFLGQLCRMNPLSVAKNVLLQRAFHHRLTCVRVNTGFIVDIVRILEKYQLVPVWEDFLKTGIFPSKLKWKTIYTESVQKVQEDQWKDNLDRDDDFTRFKAIHSTIQPSSLWLAAKRIPRSLQYCSFAVFVLTRPKQQTAVNCRKCDNRTNDEILHLTLTCESNSTLRIDFFARLSITFGDSIMTFINSTPSQTFLNLLLGGDVVQAIHIIGSENYLNFIATSARFISDCFS